MDPLKLIEDQDDFIAWLKENEKRLVGRVGTPCHCPVAKWIKERTGAKSVGVCTGNGTYVNDQILMRRPYDLEHWTSVVVGIIDRISIPGAMLRGGTVLKALEVCR